MRRFSKEDRVRIDIPDETDPDHQEYHGEHGRVVAVLSDDVDSLTAEGRIGNSAGLRFTQVRRLISDGVTYGHHSTQADIVSTLFTLLL